MSELAKPFAPSARKLRRARERGEVPRSPLAVFASVMLVATAVWVATARSAITAMSELTRALLAAPIEDDAWRVALTESAAVTITVLAAPLAAIVITAALASALISGPTWSPGILAPDLGRLALDRGLARAFGGRGLLARVATLPVIAALGVVGVSVLASALPGLFGRAELDGPRLLDASFVVIEALAWRAAGVLAIAGVVAAVYARWRWREDQRMSHREVVEEQRETEGEPEARRRRAELRRERALGPRVEEAAARAVLLVRGAAVTIAIGWSDREAPPRVELVARGAARARLAALARGIPVVADEALASHLARVRAGHDVPREHWRALAKHIARSEARA